MNISTIIDFVLHIDKYINGLVSGLGGWFYVLIFAIIFAETGLVFLPFLPGDSLLFVIGSVAATAGLNLLLIIGVLLVAAILGDSVNYWVGNKYGRKLLDLKKKNGEPLIPHIFIAKTEEYFAKNGPRTIIAARFVPIVRTFAPFVAGVSKMDYKVFFKFNIIGGGVWVIGLTLLGYFFGQIPFVKEHFEVVIYLLIAASLVLPVYEYFKYKKEQKEFEATHLEK
jgi:membrane-associated protein